MAYTGINKAQWESNKYTLDANAKVSALGTVLDTSTQVGFELYNSAVKSQYSNVSKALDSDLTNIEIEMRKDTTINPDDRDKVLQQRYAEALEKRKAEFRVLPGVFKEVGKSIDERRSKFIDDWKLADAQNELAAIESNGYASLDSYVNSDSIKPILRAEGSIKDKDYKSQDEQQTDFHESFVGAEKPQESKQDDPVVFDKELHSYAYDDNVSEFDLRMRAIERKVKEMYPFQEERQKMVTNNYRAKLIETLPQKDLELNFTKDFSVANAGNWNFQKNLSAYKASLDNATYGGEPLSETKKADLANQYSDLYANFVTRNTRAATDIVNNKVKESVAAMKSEMMLDGNKKITSDEIGKIYDEAFKDQPHLRRYVTDQETADKTLGLQSEVLSLEQEYKSGFLMNGTGTSDEQKRFDQISSLMSDDQKTRLQSEALNQANISKSISEFVEGGVSYSSILEKSDSLEKSLRSGTYDSLQEFSDAVEKDRAMLGSSFADSLINQGKSYFSDKESLQNDTYKQVLNQVSEARLSDNFGIDKANELAKNLTGSQKEQVIELGKTFERNKALDNYYMAIGRNETLSSEDIRTMLSKVEDPQLVYSLTAAMSDENLKNASNAFYKLINEKDLSDDTLSKLIADYRVKDEKLIGAWNSILDSRKLSDLENSVSELDKNGALTLSSLKDEIDKSGIDQKENAAVLSQYMAKATQSSLANANKDLAYSKLNETLSKTRIDEIGAKYGLTRQDNPDFYLGWEQQTESVSVANAQKAFNKENINNTILPGQVIEIAKRFGIDEGDPAYKQMLETARANEERVKVDAVSAAKGFAKQGESKEQDVKDAGSLVGQYTKGEISKADALTRLSDMSKKLTENEYLDVYNSIASASTIKNVTNQAVFEDKVYKPFIQESDTIMPGESRKRLIEAGLDPNDFTSELANLEDTEAVNQHRQAVSKVSGDMFYLSLKERNMSDDLIASLGVPIPDTSFQRTPLWMKDHPGEKPKTAEELAKANVELAKTKMLGSTLPSGKAAPSGSDYKDIKKQYDDSAKKVYDELTNNLGNFARYNNPEAINKLDMLKFIYDDSAYNETLYKMVKSGDITMDEYKSRISEDISIYKGPEYKKVQDALKVAEGYIRSDNEYTIDSNGKRTYMDQLAVDKTVDGYKSAFFAEYQSALSNANGGYVDPKVIAERVYTQFRDASYAKTTAAMMKMLKGDTTMLHGSFALFGTGEKDIYSAYNAMFSDKALFFGKDEIDNYLGDPNGNDESMTGTAKFKSYLEMAKNGKSESEIARTVAVDSARYLGINIPENATESEIESLMKKQTNGIRARWEQLSLISKWSVDIQRRGVSQISGELVSLIDKNANITPFFSGSSMGVSIGDTRFYYDPGSKNVDPSFYYVDKQGQARTLSSTTKTIDDADKAFRSAFTNAIAMDQGETAKFITQGKGVLGTSDGKVSVNIPAFINLLQNNAETLSAKLSQSSQKYLDSLNRQAKEWNNIVGREAKEYYTNIEYFVDLPKLQKAYENNSILNMPIEEFFGYRLIGKNGANKDNRRY